MATRYVDSNATGANDGTSWANAYTSILQTWNAGDVVYVAHNHSQSQGTTFSPDFNGTLASPTHVICANSGATPPTTLAATAALTVTAGATTACLDTFYMYGFIFDCSGLLNFSNQASIVQVYESCKFRLQNNSGYRLNLGQQTGGSGPRTIWKNAEIKFANASQRIVVYNGLFVWEGGGFESGTTAPSTALLENNSGRPGQALLSNLDLSNGGTSLNIFNAAASAGGFFGVIRNSKLPTSWNGSLATGTISPDCRFEMHNCDSADTNYQIWVEDYAGTIRNETAIYHTSGASDGTTNISWKMVTDANAEYPTIILKSPEIYTPFLSAGSKTATVEIIHDSATALKDDEIWLEVFYSNDASTPLYALGSDAKADYLATAANQTTSSEAWTGTGGFTNANKQKLSVSFTMANAGVAICRVCMAKPGPYTVYVDPLATIT